jgi:hypothetical protein
LNSADWPIISYKHDDLVQRFMDRMTRDQCYPSMTLNYDNTGSSIVSVTVGAANLKCGAAVPVTFPGPVSSVGTATKEQIGSDPLTLWVKLTGAPQTFTLANPIAL